MDAVGPGPPGSQGAFALTPNARSIPQHFANRSGEAHLDARDNVEAQLAATATQARLAGVTMTQDQREVLRRQLLSAHP